MLKQVFLINTDLKMDKGKIAVQVAHGEVMYMQEIMIRFPNYKDSPPMVLRFYDWKSETPDDQIGMMKKVVLKSTQKEIIEYTWKLRNLNIWAYPIFDKGLTQVAPNSLTCLIVEPIEESKCDELFGHLKLL
jgi:PTH2 family peptidyl-tRNA hydrolase